MAANATQDSQTLQDFVSGFNACQSPKEALKFVQSFADKLPNKILTAFLSVGPENIQVICTSLAGSPDDEYTFPEEARVVELKAKLQKLLCDDDVSVTHLAFLGDDGTEVSKDGHLKDYARLTVKATLSAGDVGRLMYQAGENISVELLGQCLGNHGDFWKELAASYPENFANFAGMDIVSAIRAYLWRFRLPGEAAQIERIVDGFARSYFYFNSTKGQEVVTRKGNEDWIDVSGSGSDCETEQEDEEPAQCQSCWDEGAMGWYVRQPLSGPKQTPCCVHCGELDGDREDLNVCQGCNIVHFCRKCRRYAHRYGHAVVGQVGYGRACVAAKRAAGSLGRDRKITFQRAMTGATETSVVSTRSMRWEAISPFRDQDSVMVLAYSIIMLTTNLHSVNVKDKMKKHEFLKQNKDVNGGGNFPGDFLSKIFDDIQREELKVMRT